MKSFFNYISAPLTFRHTLLRYLLIAVVPIWLLMSGVILFLGYNYYQQERRDAHQQYLALANTALRVVQDDLSFFSAQLYQYIINSREQIDSPRDNDVHPEQQVAVFIEQFWEVLRNQHHELEIIYLDKNNHIVKRWGQVFLQLSPQKNTLSENMLKHFASIEYSDKPLAYFDCEKICYYTVLNLVNPNNKAYGKIAFRMPVDIVFKDLHLSYDIHYALGLKLTQHSVTTLQTLINQQPYTVFPVVDIQLFKQLLVQPLAANELAHLALNGNRFALTAFTQSPTNETGQPFALLVLEEVNENYQILKRALMIMLALSVIFLAVLVWVVYWLAATPALRLAAISSGLSMIGKGDYGAAQTVMQVPEGNNLQVTELDNIYHIANKLSDDLRKLEENNRAQRQHLKGLIGEDALTGVYNRRALNEMLEAHLSRQESFALFLIDLDYFKLINDTYGHQIGDTVLIQVANALQQVIGDKGKVGRSGGDEFYSVIPMAGVGTVELERLASEVINTVKNIRIDRVTDASGNTVELSLSVGIAQYPEHADNIEALQACADIAMYENKRDRKGSYQIYSGEEEMLHRLSAEKYWADQIRVSIREHRLKMSIQAIVDSYNLETIAYEALARIMLNDKAVVADIFIDSIMNSGTISQLDQAMMRIAISAIPTLQDEQLMFINLSSLSITQPGFTDMLQKLISNLPGQGKQVVFEINEKTAIVDLQRTQVFMLEMARMGVRFALDDFGKGYSSLLLIHDLPISFLKLDRSFVAGQDKDPAMRETISAVTQLCHSMGIQVIAEGVETQAQSHMMTDLQVDFQQGYFFEKPHLFDETLLGGEAK